jgi:F0F1-type ATP synthase membrane subunit c/vacuolar-type H+-ATPase subunit K
MVGIPVREANERSLLTLWVIWAGIFGTLFIYVFICHQLGDKIRSAASANFPLDLMRNILYGISIFTLILTHFLRKLILAGRPGGPGPMTSKPPSLSNQPSLLAKYTTAMLVSLGLSESIGIYGLVMFLLGESLQTLYMFMGISALAMFFCRPKREELETLAIAMQTKEASTPGF